MKKYIQKNWSTILLVVAFTVGLSLLLYPTVANWWNSIHAAQAVATYDESLAKLSQEKIDEFFEQANEYNSELLEQSNRFFPTPEFHDKYMNTLDVTNDGMMGSVYIPSIRLTLPIFHGTDEEVLQTKIGHIEGSSLPVGGPSTHTVISGHRGLPSAKLFTDIDKLAEGDYFVLRIMGRTLTYKVDQIRTVLPEETDELEIVAGKDYATLVTCTPYGINSHRLLIRGERTDDIIDDLMNNSEAKVLDRNMVALFIGIPAFIIVISFIVFRKKKTSN